MARRQSLSSLCLPPHIICKLIDSDIFYDDDIKSLTSTELGTATGLALDDCNEVLRLVSLPTIYNESETLLQMIERVSDVNHIVSFCAGLDKLLGGGIPLQAITEVCGAPGTGKTQMCLQACVGVQVPKSAGGLGGKAIYVDTEGSFVVNRLEEIAGHAVQHVQPLCDDEDRSGFTVESILRGITYFRCQSYNQLMAVMKHIPKIIESDGNVRLLVIDSIIFYFRHECPDMKARTGVLCNMIQNLMSVAVKCNIAIVLTNQLTRKTNEDGTSDLVAFLGDTWGHCCTSRILLAWNNQHRTAMLIKSPHRHRSSVQFQVTEEGIRDVEMPTTVCLIGSPNPKRRKVSVD